MKTCEIFLKNLSIHLHIKTKLSIFTKAKTYNRIREMNKEFYMLFLIYPLIEKGYGHFSGKCFSNHSLLL